MIDSSSIESLPTSADFIYDLLTSNIYQKNKP
jgi:hypothetical protein